MIFPGKVDKMVVFCANEKGNRRLIESTTLTVPFLDRVQCALPREIKHEQNSNRVITNQRKHINKLALSAQIPDREGDFRVSNRDCFFHEIDTYKSQNDK